MRNILLTGATGFLGSHILSKLIENGYRVTVLKRNKSDTSRILKYFDRMEIYDLESCSLAKIFLEKEIECVIHAATVYDSSDGNPLEQVDCNLVLGIRLLELSKINGVKLFINTNTFFTKDNFTVKPSPYVLSKSQFSDWVGLYSKYVKCVDLVLFHVFGEGDSDKKFFSWLLSSLKGDRRIPLTKGCQLRDFIYVDDVAAAYLSVVRNFKNLSGFERIEVGSGRLLSVRHAVEFIYDYFSTIAEINPPALGFGDVQLGNEERDSPAANISRLASLGWRPNFTLEEGFRRLVDSAVMTEENKC